MMKFQQRESFKKNPFWNFPNQVEFKFKFFFVESFWNWENENWIETKKTTKKGRGKREKKDNVFGTIKYWNWSCLGFGIQFFLHFITLVLSFVFIYTDLFSYTRKNPADLNQSLPEAKEVCFVLAVLHCSNYCNTHQESFFISSFINTSLRKKQNNIDANLSFFLLKLKV